ncbi:MAG: type II toxin-antitoxin system HicA family toxin [Candidatus Dormibacteria bacterium]
MKSGDLLDRAAHGTVSNVRFADLQHLVEALGFQRQRIRGSHHTYRHPALRTTVNLQPQGRQAKPYQVRQVARLALLYSLKVEDDT